MEQSSLIVRLYCTSQNQGQKRHLSLKYILEARSRYLTQPSRKVETPFTKPISLRVSRLLTVLGHYHKTSNACPSLARADLINFVPIQMTVTLLAGHANFDLGPRLSKGHKTHDGSPMFWITVFLLTACRLFQPCVLYSQPS